MDHVKKMGTSVLKSLRGVAKNVWFLASALVVPVSIQWKNKRPRFNVLRTGGKILVNFAFFSILHPMTGRLFPTAESVLDKKGYDTEVVSDLAPGLENKIHIRTDNTLGKVHAFFDNHPFISVFLETSQNNKDVVGYANTKGGVPLVYLKENEKIFPSPDQGGEVKTEAVIDTSVFHLPKNVAYLSKEAFDHIHLTVEEEYLSLLFHEIRHHAKDNSFATTIENEADAEYHAALAVAKIKNQPEFVERYIDKLGRKMFTETHNVALILDAAFNGKAKPSATEVKKANADAQVIIDMLWDQNTMEGMGLCDKWPEQHKNICEADKNTDCLSDLAKRRIALFEEGTRGAMKRKT